MGMLGWYILLYLMSGWLVDAVAELILTVKASRKDLKSGNNDRRCMKALDAEVKAAIERCSQDINGLPGTGELKTWIKALLLWPITIPVEFAALWRTIEET